MLQDKIKYGKNRQLGAPPVPNCDQLFDISKCPCFAKGMAAADIKLEGCSCQPKQNPDGPDKPVWTKESLAFYADQRTTRTLKAFFTCETCESLKVREGDAELAEAEDDPRESAVDPDDSQGRAEMQAHVEFEENAFMNDAGSDDDFFDTSHSPPPEMEEDEEGEEET